MSQYPMQCPICGAKIVYSDGRDEGYYLRCSKEYSHYHKNVTESVAHTYTHKLTREQTFANDLWERIMDDED